MSDHTPGPWLTCPTMDGGPVRFSVKPCRGLSVAIVANHDDRIDANVRLIASAPELLAALQGLLFAYYAIAPSDEAWNEPIEHARAAVLLATTRRTR